MTTQRRINNLTSSEVELYMQECHYKLHI